MNNPKITLQPIKRSTLTTKEAATYLGLSVDFVYILCREKRLPHLRLGSRLLFKKDALDRFIDEQIQESVQDEY